MGSVAIFIDAGYLFKQGSGAVLEAKLGRHEITLDAGRFVAELTRWVSDRYPSDDLLRTYWYDGALRGIRSPEQLVVAALPFVKLRLGRINASGQQKGVDTLIVRDLMVLSQERSIQRAIVLSGDEDLREGIEYVQDRGVRVAIVGIEAASERSQSIELTREADESLTLPRSILAACLARVTRESTAETPAPTSSASPLRTTAGAPSLKSPFAELARQFAREWLRTAGAHEVVELTTGRPQIPAPIDRSILQSAVRTLGINTIEQPVRHEMRAAFWVGIDEELQASHGLAT